MNSFGLRHRWSNIPAHHPDVLSVLDSLTGDRRTTVGILNGMSLPGGGGIIKVQASSATLPSGWLPSVGARGVLSDVLDSGIAKLVGGALSVGGEVFTAAQMLSSISPSATRAEVSKVIQRYSLDSNNAADVLAANAFVKAQIYGPAAWPAVPFTGPLNTRVAEAVMRFERAHPTTFERATSGFPPAVAAIDQVVAGALAGQVPEPEVYERTNPNSAALSASSTRARTILGIMGFQAWRAHHLIPFAEILKLPIPVQIAIGGSGWQMDSIGNLVPLPANQQTYLLPPNDSTLPIHSNSHPNYSLEVGRKLAALSPAFVKLAPDTIKETMDALDIDMLAVIIRNPLFPVPLAFSPTAPNRYHERLR